MAVFEKKLDELYSIFREKRNYFDESTTKKISEKFLKRLIYYCKSRFWAEQVFGLQWESGLNLRQLLTPDHEVYIISEHSDPTQKVYAGGKSQYHFVFCTISPVLQRIVSFRLWPQQVPRARDLVVEVRKIIGDKKVPFVKLSGSIGIYWPHPDLRLQRGNATVERSELPATALSKIMLIPALHTDASDLTWWRGLSDYCTNYIATDEESRFMTGGICIAQLDQKLSDHCQMRVLNDKIRFSGQIYRFRYAGYRAQGTLGSSGSVYLVLYFREFDQKTGEDHFWLQDVIEAEPLDLLLHLIMRYLHLIYLRTGRLRLVSMEQLEKISAEYLSQAISILTKDRRQKSSTAGLKIPLSVVVRALMSGYYREIDKVLYFVPPGMQKESNDKLRELDTRMESLAGKYQEKREFFKEFLDDDDALKTVFLSWIMSRINAGLRPWISEEAGLFFEKAGEQLQPANKK